MLPDRTLQSSFLDHLNSPIIKLDIQLEEKIFEIINTILAHRSKRRIDALSPNMHLRNDIGFDSLDLAELTVRLEFEYEVDVFEDGIVNTVDEVLVKLKAG